MLAHHPLTGKEIRIMKTETHLWKNNRTLVIGYAQGPWKCLGQTLEECQKGTEFSLLVTPDAEVCSWLVKKAKKTEGLHFLSKAILEAIGQEQLERAGFQNAICLEDIRGLYPHLSFDDGDWVEAIRQLLRFQRTIPASEVEATKPKVWLIQQYYVPQQAKRAREIKSCLSRNLENPLIDHIVLLNERELVVPSHEKLQQIVLGKRLTYKDCLAYVHDSVPSGDYVIFANSDIWFDESLKELWSLDMSNTCLALLRWEEDTNELFGHVGADGQAVPRPDSQDTWILSADSIKMRLSRQSLDLVQFDIPFGKGGCDNAVALAFLKHKWLVANPAFTLKAWHCHASGIRGYDPKDIVEAPAFLYLEPTAIHDWELKTALGKSMEWDLDVPFSRLVDKETSPVWFSMTKREGWSYDVNTSNMYEPPKESLYTFQNAFVTPTGLVYDTQSLMLGQHEPLKDLAAETFVSPITPVLPCESVLAIPLEDSDAEDPWAYMVHYISKMLRLKEAGYRGDVWLSRTQSVVDAVQQFVWTDKDGYKAREMPVLPRDTDVVAFGKTVHMLAPLKKGRLVCREEIRALRNASIDWIDVSSAKTAAILTDERFVTKDDAEKLKEALHALGYLVDILSLDKDKIRETMYQLTGRSMVVCGYGAANTWWLLPEGSQVYEVQSELEVHGDSAHMAGACGVRYRPLLKARGSNENWVSKTILELVSDVAKVVVEKEVEKEEEKEKEKEKEKEEEKEEEKEKEKEKPVLHIPTGFEGFHGHAGDSFREMAELWAERGFVQLEKTKKTVFCWLGGLGKVLLYDRPTWDWFHNIEPVYERILVGNPAPHEGRSSAWFFWPRRPRIVEALAPQLAKTPFAERSKTLVFYGRVENAVQKRNRPEALLAVCDDSSMPISLTYAQPYKYGPEEYLQKLSQSKYGLCLRGFGPKCHREVECMAVGTVPIVAPDVDMTYYAEPPKEGVHYLRLRTFDPQEVKILASSVSESQWSTMSAECHAWWVRNASVEGSWSTTQRILGIQ